MKFIEYNVWKLKEDCVMEEYEKVIQDWFSYVAENKKELFDEWVSAKYYVQTDRDGEPNGVYVMMIEYKSLHEYNTYKNRKVNNYKENDGAYATYDSIDPCKYFESGTFNTFPMEAQQENVWFDYTDEKLALEKEYGPGIWSPLPYMRRFLEYEVWKVHLDADWDEYEKMVETWFKYVVNNKKELFDEWVSGRYFRQCDKDGNPNGVYVMIFEYDSIEGHHSYKARKMHSYALNDGLYAEYSDNDPYQFFDLDTVKIDCMQPLHEDLWFDYSNK